MNNKIYCDDYISNVEMLKKVIDENSRKKDFNKKVLLGLVITYILAIMFGSMVFSITNEKLVIGLLTTLPAVPTLLFVNKIRKNDNIINKSKESLNKIFEKQNNITATVVFPKESSNQQRSNFLPIGFSRIAHISETNRQSV